MYILELNIGFLLERKTLIQIKTSGTSTRLVNYFLLRYRQKLTHVATWGAYSFKPSAGIDGKCTQNLLQISPYQILYNTIYGTSAVTQF